MADPTMPDPTAGGDPTAGAGASDDQGTDQNILLTVLKNDDGTYTLIEGDEDEGGGGEDSSQGVGGAVPSAAGVDNEAAGAPQGQQFDSVGALMKGILDCLQKDEAGGDGSEDDNLSAGYSGALTGAPTSKQPPANMRS